MVTPPVVIPPIDSPALPRVLSYLGAHDGIRWGRIGFAHAYPCRYLFDRLNRRIGLWRRTRNRRDHNGYDEDRDPERRMQALDALLAYERNRP